ncbi:exonuclease domain-containing protein [Nocardia sp. AG03]|uniref:TerD family protein n=1 Tax=Nocardia sp. AG03 TaxID=3025312 RepID=UPI002418AA49|nr:exonuclease domain-containing protein [Nocardia sp. AG03]
MRVMTQLDERQQGTGFGAFTVVDVETSGLRPHQHRVLSVAALTLDSVGQVSEEFHTLLDPGCDPGPVHIHGLTTDVLRGSPEFAQVRDRLSGLLDGRVLVAHNALFDYGFLAREFARTGARLPVDRRLCTLALARRVAPPTPDYKLGTLASYYGVPQHKAHDALDDTRVLVQVLRALVADAAHLGIAAPLLDCADGIARTPAPRWPVQRRGPKQPCAYAYPGTMLADGPLRQGMKVAFTGETRLDREELVARAEAAGLDVTGTVSRRTSVLVTNDATSNSGKARKATEFATPVVDETRFLALLDAIEPGQPRAGSQPRPAAAQADGRRAASRARPPTGALSGRRVLVLGGTHEDAAAARTRIVALGGSVAVNLSATVTDLLVLDGGDTDRRVRKATDLALAVHGPQLLESGAPATLADASSSEPDVLQLSRGQVVDLPGTDRTWALRASWNQLDDQAVDLVAFLVDETEKVADSSDFVFYNQPEALGARLSEDGPNEQAITIALDELPEHCRRIVFAAALDGTGRTFGDVGAVELEIATGPESSTALRATLDAATTERTLLLAELYVRGDTWRLRAVGQGYETDLAALVDRYGVEVAD